MKMTRVLWFIGALLLSASQSEADGGRAAWMQDAKYGVFAHYLGGGPEWNETVDSFQVDAFAAQMKAAGAGYVMFTLGQNSGYYCSPNATYDRLVGVEPGTRCSKRDLPMEVADALAKHGIRLILYLPSRAPQKDKDAMTKLGDPGQNKPAPQAFTANWSAIIEEWSTRYGSKVSGWWFDGAYSRDGWKDLSKPYNWTTWAAACRAGNPDSILAFNSGVKTAFMALTPEEDYAAGEQNEWTVTPETHPAPPGVQWQVLSFLGKRWGKATGPHQPDEYMIDYIRRVNDLGGAVTMDVHISDDGTVYGPHQQQLEAIAKALR